MEQLPQIRIHEEVQLVAELREGVSVEAALDIQHYLQEIKLSLWKWLFEERPRMAPY